MEAEKLLLLVGQKALGGSGACLVHALICGYLAEIVNSNYLLEYHKPLLPLLLVIGNILIIFTQVS